MQPDHDRLLFRALEIAGPHVEQQAVLGLRRRLLRRHDHPCGGALEERHPQPVDDLVDETAIPGARLEAFRPEFARVAGGCAPLHRRSRRAPALRRGIGNAVEQADARIVAVNAADHDALVNPDRFRNLQRFRRLTQGEPSIDAANQQNEEKNYTYTAHDQVPGPWLQALYQRDSPVMNSPQACKIKRRALKASPRPDR